MQTEFPLKHAATQVSGCRECQSLAAVVEGSRDRTCMRCEQVEDLLSMVAELKEEVARLRSIRECKREIDRLVELLPTIPERSAPDRSIKRRSGSPALVPPGRGRGPKRRKMGADPGLAQ